MGSLSRREMIRWTVVGGVGAVLVGCGSEQTQGFVNPEPQYLVMHKTDTGGPPPGDYWYQGNPSSVNQTGIDEILHGIGERGGPTRRLAFSYSLSYLNYPLSAEQQVLSSLLALAEANDLPVLVHLDGVNWWNTRPDLWNWWDPTSPGYNPTNVDNVEWCGWNPADAVKIGWRNWGSQIRVPPQPNLASPIFMAAQKEKLDALIPMIAQWYQKLPPDRRYLLAGVVLGWETSTFVQFYYYPDGNSYLEKYPQDASHDPTGGLQDSIPLGYAGLTSLGRTHGGQITAQDMDGVISHYLEYVTGIAAQLGLPRSKLLTHSITSTALIGPQRQQCSHGMGALTTHAMPGWSFYNDGPVAAETLLSTIDQTPWGAVEFQPFGLSVALFDRFYAYRNCRFVDVFNWESARGNPSALAAIIGALRAAPKSLLSPAQGLAARVHKGRVDLSWQPGTGTAEARLQVARGSALDSGGELAEPKVLDAPGAQPGKHSLALPAGTYYWTVVERAADGTRLASDVQSFSIS